MKRLIPLFFKLLSFVSPKLAAKLALKLFSHPRRKPRADEEMDFLSTGNTTVFNSLNVAYVWGNKDHPVIWLLHGWESRSSTFYKLIPLLLAKGYQVVAWDGPAHGASPGDSTNVVDYGTSLSIDMNENRFPKAVAILGHSFGGAALAVFAKLHPMPAKTIIVSSPTRIEGVFERFFKLIKLGKKAQKHLIAVSEKSIGYSFEEISLTHNDISQLSDTLVIHDKGDDVIPYDDFETLKKTWQSGSFLSTEALGHRLTIKDATLLKDIVEFIVQSN
ncbi:MAG: alpha/beta fold hydrolase [Proteobacteria bacterium]|nr:alpha/beta fold hydrolase [Pseudomonadota bacterium]